LRPPEEETSFSGRKEIKKIYTRVVTMQLEFSSLLLTREKEDNGFCCNDQLNGMKTFMGENYEFWKRRSFVFILLNVNSINSLLSLAFFTRVQEKFVFVSIVLSS
jgi:hypothetical protein